MLYVYEPTFYVHEPAVLVILHPTENKQFNKKEQESTSYPQHLTPKT